MGCWHHGLLASQVIAGIMGYCHAGLLASSVISLIVAGIKVLA
jgi:hypothetical protein